MSQRSARTATAMATALVSDPPRPSVEMRLRSGSMPWKPVITATSPCSRRVRILSPGTSLMRATPCALSVRIGICQPCHERAVTPMLCSTIESSPAVTCSPVATMASYSRASCRGEASRTQPTSWLVTPAIAETTTATPLPASISRLTWAATLRMRSTLATDVPPNFMTRNDMATRVHAPQSHSWGLSGAFSRAAAQGRAQPQETPPSADGRTLSHWGAWLQPPRTDLDSLPPQRANLAMQHAPQANPPGTLDTEEVDRFARLSREWWDPRV